MRALVTGGAGFIGSALVRSLIDAGHVVLNLDKLTYASNLASLATVAESERYELAVLDICDREAVAAALLSFRPDIVFHLAAESHVDRSIASSSAFIDTNVVGTHSLLEAFHRYRDGLPASTGDRVRFVHVSTDEVFGALGPDGQFDENSPYRPNSPYSASKAASDHLVLAWHATYGLPVVVTNCSNNYGPCQFPEKLIPLALTNAIDGLPVPVYGTGENVRDWLYVEDHVRALVTIAERGRPGERYNIGGSAERRNIDVVRTLMQQLDEVLPGRNCSALITFVADRPGHDWRYSIDSSKLERELGWHPRVTFEEGLQQTVRWYLANEAWWRAARTRNQPGTAR